MNKMDMLDQYREYAALPLKLVFLYYLITALSAGSYQWSKIAAFSEQLSGLGFPMPIFFAAVGTYMLFIAYICIVVGWQTRLASIPIIIYFAIAIVTYHIPKDHGIRDAFPAIVLLLLGIFFLINGSGKPSVEKGI